MENTLLVLLGVFGTIMAALLALIGVLIRRNNKTLEEAHGNPNYEVIEMLCKQQLQTLEHIEGKLDAVLLALKGVETNIAGLTQVRRSTD